MVLAGDGSLRPQTEELAKELGVYEKVRFLGINTPESTNYVEEYGREASEYTCNKLKNATD